MFESNGFLYRLFHKAFLLLSLLLAVYFYAAASLAAGTIHHDLHVKLLPAETSISVSDTIQFPAGTDSTEFSLRNGLTVTAASVELTSAGESDAGRLRHYRINRLPADGKVQLSYEGKIVSDKTVGPFDMPESVLDADNVYLDGGSAWLPVFKNFPLHTSSLYVEAPEHWQLISQGKRSRTGEGFTFDMPQPQHDIYLAGGPYQRYSAEQEGIEIVVYLYESDAQLAEKYLQTSADYIRLYSDWIGRYPYAKFAVIENRWQTGYGMPSFTLLGSKVMRLPFILNTSLPHEILHNWWGNGVYIDTANGNWSEGLTAYMSDHFSNEQQGKGREYRRKALERYANFAAEQGDFALTDFRSRHDEASQAIGYSKALMVFHMLRERSGDKAFEQNIRQFWQRYQFTYASFVDLIEQLYNDHDSSNDNAERFISQWLTRTGAPEIAVSDVRVEKQGHSYLLSFNVSQQQHGHAYQLRVPLDIMLQGETQAHRHDIFLSEENNLITLKFDKQPQALTLDPDYDVFRLLQDGERPATLGRLFGAKKQLLIMSADATTEQAKAWRGLAAAWSSRYNNVELVTDDDIKTIPEAAAVWLLGWNNRLLNDMQPYLASTSATYSQTLAGRTASIDGEQLRAGEHAVVLLDADNSRTALGFIGAAEPDVITSIARKLPHYSSYGALAFELPAVNNIIKKHLPVLDSPMSWKTGQAIP